jgi:DNA-binding HxlR family transcriptional regulator
VFAEVPLRVEYSLTDFGRTLVPVLNAIAKWGRNLGDAEGTMVEIKREKKLKKEPKEAKKKLSENYR